MFEFLYSEGKFFGFYVRDKQNETSFTKLSILWSAAQSLLWTVKTGCPSIPWKDQTMFLEPELDAIRRAGVGDNFIQVVLDGIPREAKERGVYTENALKKRFYQLEKVVRKLDLVPANGGPLAIHILSYIQSVLLIKTGTAIPQSELNNERTDFSKLSTDDILQRAKYWIEMGNFIQALKYMNLLKGASRSVAKQWMNETRILLETQQAAHTLMAHAAFSGLGYLQ